MLNNVNNHEDLDFDYSEITTGVQLVCLDILKEIHRVCVENGIHYSLGAGTVIGYKLFQGYIPWDDDIDLLMKRDDYEKFISIFSQKCDPRYKVVHFKMNEKTNALYAKVYDRNTTIVENPNGKFLKNGAFIDVSVLDGVPNEYFHKQAIRRGIIAYANLYRQCGLTADKKLKRIALKVLSNKFLFKRRNRIYSWYEGFCERGNTVPHSKCAELMVKNFWNSLYDEELFDEYDEVEFEGIKTYIIRRYEDFLVQKYNKTDFVRNQPREKRMKSHSVYFTDTIGYEDFDLEGYVKRITAKNV